MLNTRSAIEAWQRGFAANARPWNGKDVLCICGIRELEKLKESLPPLCTPMSITATARESRSQSSRWVCRVWSRPFPPKAIYQLWQPDICVEAPWFSYLRMASRLTLPDAIRLGMELCGTHSTLPFSHGLTPPFTLTEQEVKNGFVSTKPIVGAEELRRQLREFSPHAYAKAVYAVQFIVDGSRSPGESRLYILLCLPVKLGGYGLPKPELNVRLDVPPKLQRICGKQHVVCDLLYRKEKLVIEYDGGYHWEGEQRMDDNIRDLVLGEMGYTVIRIDKKQLEKLDTMDMQAANIARHLGIRMRTPSERSLKARIRLRAETLDWSTDLYAD